MLLTSIIIQICSIPTEKMPMDIKLLNYVMLGHANNELMKALCDADKEMKRLLLSCKDLNQQLEVQRVKMEGAETCQRLVSDSKVRMDKVVRCRVLLIEFLKELSMTIYAKQYIGRIIESCGV